MPRGLVEQFAGSLLLCVLTLACLGAAISQHEAGWIKLCIAIAISASVACAVLLGQAVRHRSWA